MFIIIMNKEMEFTIAVFGIKGVGKTSFIQSLICDDDLFLTKDRSYALPVIYKEIGKNKCKIAKNLQIHEQNKIIIEKNKEDPNFIDYLTIYVNVTKQFYQNPPKFKINFIEFPSHEDMKNKDIYLEWLKKESRKFKAVFYLTDTDNYMQSDMEMEYFMFLSDLPNKLMIFPFMTKYDTWDCKDIYSPYTENNKNLNNIQIAAEKVIIQQLQKQFSHFDPMQFAFTSYSAYMSNYYRMMYKYANTDHPNRHIILSQILENKFLSIYKDEMNELSHANKITLIKRIYSAILHNIKNNRYNYSHIDEMIEGVGKAIATNIK